MDWSVLMQEAPGLAALIVIVFGFLRYMEKRDKRQEDVARECSTAIQKNSEVMGGVIEVVRKCNGRV